MVTSPLYASRGRLLVVAGTLALAGQASAQPQEQPSEAAADADPAPSPAPAPAPAPSPPPAPSPAPAPSPPPTPEPESPESTSHPDTPTPDLRKARFSPGKGLDVESADRKFALTMRLRAQFLYTLLDEPGEDLAHLLQIRRARIQFGGHMFGEHNKFKAEFAFSPRDESVRAGDGPGLTPLLDWYAEFDHLDNANVRIGQYKVPFSRQRVISSGDLQLVDRALAQGEFNLDRDIGFHVFSPDLGGLGHIKYYAGAWMNEGRDANTFSGLDMMYIARAEVLPFGMFADYKEADLERRDSPGLSIGMAYAYLDDASRDRGILGSVPDDEGTTDVHALTADALFKLQGVSVFGEFFYRKGDRTPGGAVDEMGVVIPTAPPRDGVGWFLQAGYLLPSQPIEFAARYSEVRPVGDDSALDQEHEAGAGISWYPGKHSFKVQADYFRIWSDAVGDGANQIRVQLQLAN